MELLPARAYNPAPLRTEPEYHVQPRTERQRTRCPPPGPVRLPSPPQERQEVEDDFPTPRATGLVRNPIQSPTFSVCPTARSDTSNWRDSIASCSTDSSDWNDTSDNDSEIVPFKVSASVKRVLQRSNARNSRPSSLAIPSPGMWPTARKVQKGPDYAMPLMSPLKTPLSPEALAKVAGNSLRVPASHCTPSLDGSLTSEEVGNNSCPATPETQNCGEATVEWDLPVQLNPRAMDTLLQISSTFPPADFEHSLDPLPTTQPKEMQERGLNLSIMIPRHDITVDAEEVLSAISVPSPGGFFSSLNANAQAFWSMKPPEPEEPSTSTAAHFYGLPWEQSLESIKENVLDFPDTLADGPPTARRASMASEEIYEVDEMRLKKDRVYEYDAGYDQKLHETAVTNLSRTSLWLSAQETYLAALKSPAVIGEKKASARILTPPASPSLKSEASEVVNSPPKRTVKFSKTTVPKTPATAIKMSHPATTDALMYHAFQHMKAKARGNDAFQHRNARFDALQTQRAHLPAAHCATLQGKFTLKTPEANNKATNGSAAKNPEAAQQKEIIELADKERDALTQLSVPFWSLEAGRLLNGGSLLPTSAITRVRELERNGAMPRILDLGGQPTADWGWAVALEYRNAKIHTVVNGSSNVAGVDWTAHRGPSNHRTMAVTDLWTLPFPDGSFDVVSARSLHSLLHTAGGPLRNGQDEFDATLAEIHRVLAPGGVLQFTLLDAEINAPPNSSLMARSVEFAVGLRTRGYDPCASRKFVPRLDKAGFGQIERSWMTMPLGTSGCTGMEAVSGLVASLAWEKWMLKLQTEMGKPQEKLLEGVAKALEDARRADTIEDSSQTSRFSWKMLVGCAQKPGWDI